jgi:hypothetical protein
VSPRTAIGRLWVLLVLFGAAGCDVGVAAQPVLPLSIPGSVPTRRTNGPKEEDRGLPTEDAVARDPFVHKADLDALLRKNEPPPPVVVAEVVAPADASGKPVVKKVLVPALDRLLDLELQSLFTNRVDGKRHAVARDRRTKSDVQIDEGQAFGEFVVMSIADDGITLKQRGGANVRKIPFRKAAEDVFFFKPKTK